MTVRFLPILVFLGALAGCGDGDPSADVGAPEAIAVLATTTHAADLARNVMCVGDAGGSCANGPVALLEGNTDPHDYELRPQDVERLAEADVIVRSGGEIDEWLDEAIEASGSDAPVVDLLKAAGGDDPHWWTDPRAAQRAVEAIRDALVEADPGAGQIYRTVTSGYLDRLSGLDEAIADCVEQVPSARRKVVTTHDALGPFARRYGIDIVGTVIPSRSTQAQPSSGDVARLVRDIRRAGATAVFSEAYVSRDVERAIARQAGARLGRPLRLDSLGEESYLSATAKNADALVEGMSGGTVKCSLPS